jgi:hypothetical protein
LANFTENYALTLVSPISGLAVIGRYLWVSCVSGGISIISTESRIAIPVYLKNDDVSFKSFNKCYRFVGENTIPQIMVLGVPFRDKCIYIWDASVSTLLHHIWDDLINIFY